MYARYKRVAYNLTFFLSSRFYWKHKFFHQTIMLSLSFVVLLFSDKEMKNRPKLFKVSYNSLTTSTRFIEIYVRQLNILIFTVPTVELFQINSTYL